MIPRLSSVTINANSTTVTVNSPSLDFTGAVQHGWQLNVDGHGLMMTIVSGGPGTLIIDADDAPTTTLTARAAKVIETKGLMQIAADGLENARQELVAIKNSAKTTPDADSMAKRLNDGRLKGANASANDDLVPLGQLSDGAFGPDCTSFGFGADAIALPGNDFAQITDKTAHYFADVNSLNGPPVAGNYQVFALSRTDTVGDTFNYGSVLCIHRDNGTIYNASVNNGVWNWYLNFSTKNLGTVVADSASVNGSQDAVKFRSDKGGVDFSNDTTSGVNPITFFNPNGAVGSISTSGTATSYNTSSDPRLKTPVPGALSDADINAKFNALLSTFLRFHWINDPNGPEVWGFDAHAVIDAGLDMGTEGEGPRESELGDEYEPAVYDGDELVTPAKVVTPAGVDQAKAVPILLQKIAQLESRLAVLEGN